MLEEPAEKLDGVEVGGAGARPAHFPVGEGDRTVREADDALVGEGDPENRGGKGGEGGVAVVIEASHSCMTIRGVNKPDSSFVTSAMRGAFKEKLATRSEVMSLLSIPIPLSEAI